MTAGATHDASGNVLFGDASGVITLTPESSSNNGVSLNLPYYLVTRARSNVDADLRGDDNNRIRLSNRAGAIAGNGDFYAWGLKNPKTGTIEAAFEPRAVGVQTNPISATDSILVFAVNTYGRFSNPASGEYDILIDVNGDGVYDYILFSGDLGAVETGTASGQIATFLVNLKTNALTAQFAADAPTDGSIVLMPVFAESILHGGARELGILMAASGFGALGGALSLAGRRDVRGLGAKAGLAAGAFGVTLGMFSMSRSFWLSVALLVPVGYSLMVQMAASNTLIQAMVPDALRGRVMSVYSMMFLGMAPFGGLLAGYSAEHIGAPATVARVNRASRPMIRSMTIDAMACVFFTCIRTRYAALIRSPPTAPGITRLKRLPMNPSKRAARSRNVGSTTRTRKNQRTKVRTIPVM